jgi:hypothetical protein
MRIFSAALCIVLFIVICSSAYVLLQKPSNTRDWLPEYDRVATADTATSSVTIHNVRDWTYTDRVLTQDWETRTVDPHAIVRTWFIVEPFGAIKGIGHTFLSFEFNDGTVLSFSVQARQQQSETYSAFRGLLNTYELAYQWGEERDFIARRLLFLGHTVRLYPLTISPEDSTRIFLAAVAETNILAKHPRFYNTLTANCTNMLAKIVNKYYPHRLPYDISWNLTGLADLYLMREGLIETNGKASEDVRATYDLTPNRATIMTHATSSPVTFSAYLRTIVPH